MQGTSPRTRGKPNRPGSVHEIKRNIPAHAGKTLLRSSRRRFRPEHPRARGENFCGAGHWFAPSGTSPRTRGKRTQTHHHHAPQRNIPAHAGKTGSIVSNSPPCGEHPRARGENRRPPFFTPVHSGTSPRTRGKRVAGVPGGVPVGNIPAHAGKTGSSNRPKPHR